MLTQPARLLASASLGLGLALIGACSNVPIDPLGLGGGGDGTDGGAGEDDGHEGADDGDGGADHGDGGTDDGDGGADDGGDDGDGDVKFDVGAMADVGGGVSCACGSKLDFSYIWIANSTQGTVSRINTRDVLEEGRYLTRPDGAGNPSRTSVSLSGRAVAVANRAGGVVKIWSEPEMCDPMNNGVPGLQTSTGKDDILAWGADDCVAWYTPFDDSVSQRPIAWIASEQDPATCEYSNEQLWTARSGQDGILAHLLNGDDGSVVASVETGMNGNWYGQYGGAVDSKGDFWIAVNGIAAPNLAVVHLDDLTVERFEFPDRVAAYGITVDSRDRVWLSSNGFMIGVSSYDPNTNTWTIGNGGFLSYAGVVETADHRIWTGDEGGELLWFNGDDATLGAGLMVDSTMVKGVSVDMEGYVWAVTFGAAFKVDPDTMQVVGSYDGLNDPYTYSDMTGWALQNTACRPEG